MVNICRSNPRQTKPPQQLNDDFISLQGYDLDCEDEYIFDDSDCDDDLIDNVCPPYLSDMLVIVANTRRKLENQKQQLLSKNYDQESNLRNIQSNVINKSNIATRLQFQKK